MTTPDGADSEFIARHLKLFKGEKEKIEVNMLAQISWFQKTFGAVLYNIDTAQDEAGNLVKFTLNFKL